MKFIGVLGYSRSTANKIYRETEQYLHETPTMFLLHALNRQSLQENLCKPKS